MLSAESREFFEVAEVFFNGELSFSHVNSCGYFVEISSSSPAVSGFLQPFS
jgi:hypothetical protein